MVSEQSRHGFDDDAETRALLRSPPTPDALAWVADCVGSDVVEWEVLRGGTSSAMYAVTVDGQARTDVVLRWQPVRGAAAYELQVSPNGDWANNTTVSTTVKGVQYAPAVTLDNASYFWRVRAVDAGATANKGPWSAEGLFTRHWSSVPSLLEPQDQDVAVGEPTFSWTPVHNASRYELQLGTDRNFSPGTYKSCTTDHTRYTPYQAPPPFFTPPPCNVALGQTYYWRVRGLDDPKLGPVLGGWSATHSFLYRKPLPVVTGPADGATTSSPVLSWNPVADAEQYVVTIVKANGALADRRTTGAVSYSPLTALNPQDGPFSWYVTTKDLNGDVGLTPAREQWRSFNLAAVTSGSATPEPVAVAPSAPSSRMPSLRWQPVTGAAHYTVQYLANGVFSPLQTNVPFAALTDPDAPLPVGSYAWFVQAFAKDGSYLGRSGAESTFSV